MISVMESKGYAFQMELIIRAKRMGYRIAEVLISFVDRLYDKSKLDQKEIVDYIKGVLRLCLTV